MLAEAAPASKEAKDPTVELRTVPSLRSDLRSLIKWTRVGGSWIKRTDNKSWLEGTCARPGEGSLRARSGPHLAFLHIQPDTHVFYNLICKTKRMFIYNSTSLQPDMLQRIFIYNTAPLLIVHPAVQHAFK